MNLSLWEHLFQDSKEVVQGLLLRFCASIGRMALLVDSAIVADADGTAVVWSAVSTHFKLFAVLRPCAILADVEVVANGEEATALVVASINS